MQAPIFVVGANRSGTTLLRLILNAHSRIAIPEETEYIDSCFSGVEHSDWRSFDGTPEAYARFVDTFLDRNHEAAFPELDCTTLREAILSSKVRDYREPYRQAMEAWAHHHGKERWGEKTPSNLFYVDVILDMFPDAKFIHLVRDPRAGVLSMMNTHMFEGDVAFNALNRRKYMADGFSFLRRTVPREQWMTLRYEDLVAEPEAHVAALCDFLDEAFEPDMLGFYKESSRYMKAEASSSFNAAATKPISKAKKDKWREAMSPKDIAVVEALCADEMRMYGYTPEGITLGPVDQFSTQAKALYWNVQVWRFRHIRHYIIQYVLFERSRKRLRRLMGRGTDETKRG